MKRIYMYVANYCIVNLLCEYVLRFVSLGYILRCFLFILNHFHYSIRKNYPESEIIFYLHHDLILQYRKLKAATFHVISIAIFKELPYHDAKYTVTTRGQINVKYSSLCFVSSIDFKY